MSTPCALLDHTFTVDGYIAFLTEYDEETLFEEMGCADRRRFLMRFRERLMALDPDEHFRAAIVYASGVRSASRQRGPARWPRRWPCG